MYSHSSQKRNDLFTNLDSHFENELRVAIKVECLKYHNFNKNISPNKYIISVG